MKRTTRPGYVALPKSPREIASRKYPFALIKEGEFLDPPWPIADLDRVRSATRHWNLTRNASLHVSVHRDGFEKHGPCVIVGWPKNSAPAVPGKRGVKKA